MTVDDYFDVVEVAEPYVPPEEDDEDDEPRRSGGGSSVATSSHNALYISLLHMCNGTPKIILEVTDDTGIVSGALVNVKSSITGDVDMDFTAGSDGRVEFEIPVGAGLLS